MYDKFIVFEGIEGCGKSTQIDLTAQWLRELGLTVTTTKQPGGTSLGEKIRTLLLGEETIDPRTEALLFAADRAQHRQFLVDAIANSDVVLCDRYILSSIAYQGFGRQLGWESIEYINKFATHSLLPDLTIWLDVPVEVGLSRAVARGKLDRLELESPVFHYRCREGFAFEWEDDATISRIDGDRAPDVVQIDIQAAIQELLEN